MVEIHAYIRTHIDKSSAYLLHFPSSHALVKLGKWTLLLTQEFLKNFQLKSQLSILETYILNLMNLFKIEMLECVFKASTDYCKHGLHRHANSRNSNNNSNAERDV